ncbi:hypothetical protein ASA1KI_32810 [Opitutales bacterium ASA1]|nr:hypothetical protein ASA1KI_32810 [Opitutales bacterium ASA1]
MGVRQLVVEIDPVQHPIEKARVVVARGGFGRRGKTSDACGSEFALTRARAAIRAPPRGSIDSDRSGTEGATPRSRGLCVGKPFDDFDHAPAKSDEVKSLAWTADVDADNEFRKLGATHRISISLGFERGN